MLYPSIFGENLFDDFFRFPDFSGDVEKKLYGKHAAQVMKTDVHDHDDHYEIMLGPVRAYDAPTELNDLSVVLHVRYGETAVLLAGDAEARAENRMLDTFPASMLRADVLKLGHHGSSTSTGYAFFLAVDPDYAVASCGKDNDYGHPHLETLSLLYDTHTAFYRTDCDGSVTFRLNGETVSVECSRKETP